MVSSLSLGDITSPVLVFGGAYSNLQATQALQNEALKRGILPSHIICNGDMVAYCADPEATLDLIRDWGIHVVMGNCEASLGSEAFDCGCGFDEGTACSQLSVNWYRYALNQVRPDQKNWMTTLPARINLNFHGQKITFIHGGVKSINRFIFPSTPEHEKAKELATATADIVIGGHSGIPFGQPLASGYWLNSGAIGMPANDGTPRGWFLLLEPDEEGITVSWHPLQYDYLKAADRMITQGLNQGYHRTLVDGLWPSMDVLPDKERNQCGEPLCQDIFFIPSK